MIPAEVRRGRRRMAALMTDTCTIRRKTGETTDGDGVVTETTVTVYTGKCRIQVRGIVGVGERTAGEQPVVINAGELQLPVEDSPGLAVDDVATINTCPGDADMVDARWRIQELFHKSHATSRRLGVRSLPWEAS